MIQQYLTFTVENTRYAINVFKIQEVLEYQEPQRIPCSSPLLLGIIRSRDTNIAIMDLRKKFGLPSKTPGTETRTIVLEVDDYETGVINLYGIVADQVYEVIELDSSKLEELPKAKNFSGAEFVSSVFINNDAYTLILDVNKIFSQEEMATTSTQKPVQKDDVVSESGVTIKPKKTSNPVKKESSTKTSRRTK